MQKKLLKFNLIALAVCMAQNTMAMQALNDETLSQVSGQSGITVAFESDYITADQINWKDNTTLANNTSAQLNLSLNDVQIYRNLDAPTTGSVVLDVGKSATLKPQIGIDAQLGSTNIYVGKIAVCANGGMGADCDQAESLSMGALTLQNRSPLRFKLITQDGLFSPTERAYVELAVNNVNILHTLESAGQYNQVGLKDFNFNLKGELYLYISPTRGIVASTNMPNVATSSNEILLERVTDLDNLGKTKPGFNVDLRHKADVGANYFDYGLTETDNKSILRIGASGRLRDAELTINADRINLGAASLNNQTATTDASGTTGLHLSAKASFTRDTVVSGVVTNPGAKLEIGASGKNTFAVEFGNIAPIQVRKLTGGSLALNEDLSKIDFGDIYINTIKSDSMDFQIGQNIANLLGRAAGVYRHTLYDNQPIDPNILAVAVRGMSLEGIARNGRFIADNSNDAANPTVTQSGQWGIGIPIYNLNANIGLYGINYGANSEKQGIGFGLALSTDGRDATGTKTTSLLLIDSSPNPFQSDEAYYGYAGLRNIDLFIDAKGAIGFIPEGIEIDLSQFVIAMGAEVAFGQLPGSRYGVAGCSGSSSLNCFVPADSFTQSTDVLFGIGLRLDGSGNIQIIPQPTLAADLRFKANLNLAASAANENRNFLRISDKANGASLGVDRITGELTATTDLKFRNNAINLDTTLLINPTQSASKVLTADLNLYPNAAAAGQNLGRIAFTGGSIRSNLTITPR